MRPLGEPQPRRRKKYQPANGRFGHFEQFCRSRAVGVATRVFAMAFLSAAALDALVLGGHFEREGSPLKELADNSAHYIGWSAEEIKISGLKEADPQHVLQAIGVRRGGSLIGFDAGTARARLEGLDWVANASVKHLFPNR